MVKWEKCEGGGGRNGGVGGGRKRKWSKWKRKKKYEELDDVKMEEKNGYQSIESG